MRFRIQRSVFTKQVKKVAGALVTGKTASDTGQYMTIQADAKENKLVVKVVRPDLVAFAEVRGESLPEDLLRVEKGGSCSFDGARLLAALTARDVDGPVSASLAASKGRSAEEILADVKKKRAADGDPLGDKEEEELTSRLAATPPEVGAVNLAIPGPMGKPVKYALQCVDIGPDEGGEDPEAMVSVKPLLLSDYVSALGMAVGKPTEQRNYCNVLMEKTDGKLRMVTSNGQQLAKADIPIEGSDGDLSVLVPYDLACLALKSLGDDGDVKIVQTAGSPSRVIFEQDMEHGSARIGRTVWKPNSGIDKFAQYEHIIKGIDFNVKFSFSRQEAKGLCNDLATVKNSIRTRVTVNPKNGMAEFFKQDMTGSVETFLPIEAPEGDSIELDLSSTHLAACVAKSASERMQMMFSGKSSLALLVVDDYLQMYFSPFTK